MEPSVAHLLTQHMGTRHYVAGATLGFPWNGAKMSFFAMLCGIATYVTVSLLTCRRNFNMDKLLHRGAYALEDTPKNVSAKVGLWKKITGIDENFTKGDRWIAGSLAGLGWALSLIAIVGSFWHLVLLRVLPREVIEAILPWIPSWSAFWHVTTLVLPIFFCLVTGVWYTWGGVLDLRYLFRHLRRERINPADDGTVLREPEKARETKA